MSGAEVLEDMEEDLGGQLGQQVEAAVTVEVLQHHARGLLFLLVVGVDVVHAQRICLILALLHWREVVALLIGRGVAR